MEKPNLTPLEGPCVWTGESLAAAEGWRSVVGPGEAAALKRAARAVIATGKSLEAVRRVDFQVPEMQATWARISRELEHGHGFVLVRGVPVEDLSDEECKFLFWGIGLQLGVPLSQSRLQNYIAEVRDIGEKMGQATTRAYRAGGPLRFHTDQCDALALLCLREPISGGHSRVVSSAAIHNEAMRRRPDLLPVLCAPFCFSRQGEEVEGEAPWYERPIFDRSLDGSFTSLFSLSFIESAQRLPEVPRLTAVQREALDLVAKLAEELSTTIELRKGDMQFFNNHVVYHSRTDYQDHDDVAKRRTQLRLWLATPDSRRLPDGAGVFFGATQPGAIRGGITPPTGRRFAFEEWHSAGWTDADLRMFRSGRGA
ncbi:Taurine catabolism dioxygenase TauD, TfdA family [Variovorax sp. PBL-H6]|uniref:TauD/TfdA family dioxygenase n=1 Tax=Variovorax sp. PBL-H6 TaxID=434009 RepID=UPI001317A200|nr:TauD/TfdA family dioxygenase [Variovorax sp. PBL-H6]VTU15172.1 Taurine catabolism dioxygenase TauD, TfdA family [Variovorax sp. PBL-H6]